VRFQKYEVKYQLTQRAKQVQLTSQLKEHADQVAQYKTKMINLKKLQASHEKKKTQ